MMMGNHGLIRNLPHLVHPDAPPMVFHSSDRKTLINFFHNRHTGTQYTGLSGTMDGMKDRSEIWVTLSSDGGRNWSEPRFLFANATQMNPEKNGWFNHQVSYLDAVIRQGNDSHFLSPSVEPRGLPDLARVGSSKVTNQRDAAKYVCHGEDALGIDKPQSHGTADGA